MIAAIRWLVFVAWLGWIGYYWSAGQRAVADLKKAMQSERSPLDARLMATMGLMTIVIGVGALSINCGALEVGAAPAGSVNKMTR